MAACWQGGARRGGLELYNFMRHKADASGRSWRACTAQSAGKREGCDRCPCALRWAYRRAYRGVANRASLLALKAAQVPFSCACFDPARDLRHRVGMRSTSGLKGGAKQLFSGLVHRAGTNSSDTAFFRYQPPPFRSQGTLRLLSTATTSIL